MVKRTEPRRSTFGWSTALRMVGWAVTPLWVAPALYYNLDWVTPGMGLDNLWAAVLVIAGACSFGALHFFKDWPIRLVAALLGCYLIYNNSWNALENISTQADLRIDGRKAEIARSSSQRSGRSGWSMTIDEARVKV